jgi:hypothetical protein
MRRLNGGSAQGTISPLWLETTSCHGFDGSPARSLPTFSRHRSSAGRLIKMQLRLHALGCLCASSLSGRFSSALCLQQWYDALLLNGISLTFYLEPVTRNVDKRHNCHRQQHCEGSFSASRFITPRLYSTCQAKYSSGQVSSGQPDKPIGEA